MKKNRPSLYPGGVLFAERKTMSIQFIARNAGLNWLFRQAARFS